MSEQREWICGEQRVLLEAPDLLRLEMHGVFDLPAVDAYLRLLFEITDHTGNIAFIGDLGDLQGMPSDARGRFTRVGRPYPFRAGVLYGASFTSRTLMSMAFKAGRVLAPSHFTFPFHVCRTEAEALAWIAPFRGGPASG